MGRVARLQIVTLGVAMAAAAVALLATGVIDRDAPAGGSFTFRPIVLIALFAAAEAAVVHVLLRRQTVSASLSEIPLVLGLFFVSPVALVLTRLGGAFFALVLLRRQPALKAFYNFGYFSLETVLIVLVFQRIVGDGELFGPAGWAAALVAGLFGISLAFASVCLAIWVTERSVPAELGRTLLTLGVPTTFVNITLGLLAATLMDIDGRTAALMLAFSTGMFLLYRSHSRLLNSHKSLGQLYDVTRTVDDALERGGAVETLLQQTAELMQAEVAELVLLDDDRPVEGPNAAVREVLGDRKAVVLTGRKDRATLGQLGYRDAILFGLRRNDVLVGWLLVADRLGNVVTFTEDDRRVFEALGNHAGIALRNSTLLERLRVQVVEREHEALHDNLTALPNRTLFDRRVADLLARRGPHGRVAVLLIDLDRFKEVNDTLGHHQGDRLLVRAGRRIVDAVGDAGVVARLGGDEFAIVLDDNAGDDGIEVARRVRRSIEQPFDLDGIPVAVGASIGIAVAPEDAEDPATLLQRADVAMYTAKRGSGIERYHHSVNHYTPERLAMVAELRRAIDQAELSVLYQPCVDLRTGEVVAVEALARWQHPEHGFVPPDVFIPVAERSGLIRGLTSHVLRTALVQTAAWARDGLHVRMAVNLSVQCLDDRLREEIEGYLDDLGLAPSALSLEVTETAIMSDPGRNIEVLESLRAGGIELSVDDYGTGYSSLAYLKHLPVDELKIDRAFVSGLEGDRRDAVIVRNTIELAHELSLRIVAEGVEDAATQSLLTAFGCDLAQGYHFCRPVTAAEVLEFAAARQAPPFGTAVVPCARFSALEHELGEMSGEAVLRTQDRGSVGIVADSLHHQQG